MIGNSPRHAASAARKLWLLLAIATALLLTTAAGNGPQTGAQLLVDSNAIRYKILGHRMRCTCGCGEILLECTHGFCETTFRMRDELRAALQKGDTDDAILRSFSTKYGSAVLTPPNIKDVTRLAWIIGVALIAAIASITIVLLRKRRSRPVAATPTRLSELDGVEADMLRRRVRAQTEDDDW